VVPNGLGHAQLAAAEVAYKAAGRAAADGIVRIAYLSGTTMHDHDLAAVAPALAAVLAAHPEVRLRIVGYLHLDATLAPFADRIERLPFLPWPEVFTALADVEPEAWRAIERRPSLRVAQSVDVGAHDVFVATGPDARLVAAIDGSLARLIRVGRYGLLFAKYFPGTPLPSETGS